jgi:hypothetical protein
LHSYHMLVAWSLQIVHRQEPQMRIVDDPENTTSVRDNNRERKRRQRCAWICSPILSHDCVMTTVWICIPITCVCHGHCMDLHSYHYLWLITADCAQGRSTDA